MAAHPLTERSHGRSGALSAPSMIRERAAMACSRDVRPEAAASGGLHLPETLVAPDEALARFKQFGVQVVGDA